MKVSQPEFGERLRTRRAERGLSQKALGGTVITPSYISLLERGDRVPTLDVVVYLAQALQTSVADLLGPDFQEPFGTAEQVDHEDLIRLLEARGYAESGDLDAARASLTARMAVLRARGADDRLLEAGIQLSNVVQGLGDHAARLELVDELLDLPLVQATAHFQLPLLTDRMSTLRDLSRLVDARMVGWRVLELFTGSPLAGGAEHVRALGVFGSVLCELGDFELATNMIDDMLRMADDLGHSGVAGRAYWLASMAQARMGRPEKAAELLERARQSLSFATMPTLEWLRLCRSIASVMLSLSDYDAAREWLQAAAVTARMTGLEVEQAAVVRERARYELAVGNPAAAAELFASVAEPGSPLSGLDLIGALFGLADALQQLGRDGEAVVVLRRAAEQCEQNGSFRQAAEAWRRVDELRHAGAREGTGRTASGRTASGHTASDRGDAGRTASGRTASDRGDAGRAASGRTASDRGDAGRTASARGDADRTATARSRAGRRRAAR